MTLLSHSRGLRGRDVSRT